MGGRPLTALSIAAFPEKDFPLEWAAAIVRGGSAKLAEAGCVLLGGHSVRDPGDQVRLRGHGPRRPGAHAHQRRAAARATSLVLTKPLGTGRDRHRAQGRAGAPEAAVAAADALAWPRSTAIAAEAGAARTACAAATDITGFGLAGHASGVARESGVTLEIEARRAAAAAGRARAGRSVPAGRAQGQPPPVRAAGRVRRRSRRRGAGAAALRPPDLGRPAAARPGGRGRPRSCAELPQARAHRPRAAAPGAARAAS